MGKANAFTAPITVVNYDEQALNNTEARTLVDAVAKKDASVWQFGGESNTLTGLYFRGYQLDARQYRYGPPDRPILPHFKHEPVCARRI